MIKKLFSILLLLLISIATVATAQTNNKDNLLFLLRKKEHVTQALVTVEQLRQTQAKNSTIRAGEIAIIVCGADVKALTDSSFSETVKKARLLNVHIWACGLSLKKFNLDRQQLLPGIEYTPNGFIKAFELQKQGYLSVEL